jgi:hypothetical protein
MFQFAIIVRGDADMDTNYDADSCLQFCMQTLFSSYAAALEIMSVMEEDKGRNENFRRERVKKICSRELADMLLKTPRLQHTALTAENEVGLSLGFCCVAVIAGWDDEALLLCQESPLCTIKGVTMQVTPEPLCYERTGIHTPEQAITLSATRR